MALNFLLLCIPNIANIAVISTKYKHSATLVDIRPPVSLG